MTLEERLALEREYHDSEDKLRDANSLIVGFYSSGLFDEAFQFALNELGDIRGRRVLDFGCGTGESTAQLQARGAQVTAFDISHVRLKTAQSNLGDDPTLLQSTFALAAAENLPFATHSFDAVFGKQVLHHLDLTIASGEIRRVLKHTGKAVFMEPLIHNPVLEAYRRLTPRLRSPGERALSMHDVQVLRNRFGHCAHHEFCFLSILPVFLETVFTKGRPMRRLRGWTQRADHKLEHALPFMGRYYWEIVLTMENLN